MPSWANISTCPLRRFAFFYLPTYGHVPSVGFDSHLARAIIVRRHCAFYLPTATLRRVRLPGSTVSTERESTQSTERERIWRRAECVYVAEYRKGKVKLIMMASAGLAKAPEYRKGKDLAEGRMCLRSRVPKGKSEIPHQRFFQFKPRRSDETLSRWLLRPRKEAG